MQDKSIISSIKPKFDNQFFVDIYVFMASCGTEIVLQIKSIQKRLTFSTRTKQVNQQRIDWKILA